MRPKIFHIYLSAFTAPTNLAPEPKVEAVLAWRSAKLLWTPTEAPSMCEAKLAWSPPSPCGCRPCWQARLRQTGWGTAPQPSPRLSCSDASFTRRFAFYLTSMETSLVELLTANLAFSHFGGPKVTLTLFENPYGSRGIPNKFLSILPLLFSS